MKKLFLCHILGLHDHQAPTELAPPPPVGASMFEVRMTLYKACRMLCTRCGHESEPSSRFLVEIYRKRAETFQQDMKFCKEHNPEVYWHATRIHGENLTSEILRDLQLEHNDYGFEIGMEKHGMKYIRKYHNRNDHGCYYWVHVCESEGKEIKFGNDELHYFFEHCKDIDQANEYVITISK